MVNDPQGDRPAPNELRVLLLPPTSRDADAMQALLAQAGIHCVVCRNMHALCEQMPGGAGAVIVSEESLIAEPSGLAGCIRTQPVWSDLPIVVLSRSGVEAPALAVALAQLGNVSVLERPVRVTTLVHMVRAALRARERQYQVRSRLVEILRGASALRASEQRVRLATDAAELGIWLWDVAEDRGTWESERLYEIFGIPRTDEPVNVGRFLAEFIHPDDAPMMRQAIAHTLKTGARYYFAGRFTRGDGELRWIEFTGQLVRAADGSPRQVLGTAADITERKRAEEALRRAAAEARATAEANAKFRTFFEQGTHFAGVISLDGTVIEANHLCVDGCGFTRAEVIGRKFWECGWWNRSPALMEMIRAGSEQAAAGREFRLETNYFIADGSERFVELTLAPVKDDAGRVLFVAPTGTDITERKRLADERERLLEAERAARGEAERAGRMKDEFLATLSHELRTPLNAIFGWAQILKMNPSDAADVAEGMEIIERNARAQTQIVEDLLDMSRIISGKVRLDVQGVELASVVAAAVETVRPAADAKTVRIRVTLDPLATPVSGDPNRLQQVFWNLLNNAVKFTPKGGQVQVLMERINAHLEVSVIDTGEGISSDFLPHVFDRFRQADASTTRRHGGLGLGLAIVKQLVELHGGTIRAKSAGGGTGSTFVVSLPLTITPPDPQPAEGRRQTAAPGSIPRELGVHLGGLRVLVVDDEPDARALLRRLLEDCDAVVSTASSATEAMERLGEDHPDVLVSDIGMPLEDGYSLIRRIRALGADRGGKIPAIALTAYARVEDRMKAIRAGFQHHVAKPVEPAELITMVASLSGRNAS